MCTKALHYNKYIRKFQISTYLHTCEVHKCSLKIKMALFLKRYVDKKYLKTLNNIVVTEIFTE